MTHAARRGSDRAVEFHHLDVFSATAYAGNSVAVFVDPPPLDVGQMTRITIELRHFETIFVATTPIQGVVGARVFDLFGELDFAGHPVLGAAAVLHDARRTQLDEERVWTFELTARTVQVRTRGHGDGQVSALLDQGRPDLISVPVPSEFSAIAAALGLTVGDLDETLPPEVLSTGLRYLVVPVRDGEALVRARVAGPDFEQFLHRLGAQFVYVLDAAGIEGRHWNNDGLLEDVATGSAAGCVAGYLMRHGRTGDGEQLSLAQGRFTGRPSRIEITAYGTSDDVQRVTVGGDVSFVATGKLHVLPSDQP